MGLWWAVHNIIINAYLHVSLLLCTCQWFEICLILFIGIHQWPQHQSLGSSSRRVLSLPLTCWGPMVPWLVTVTARACWRSTSRRYLGPAETMLIFSFSAPSSTSGCKRIYSFCFVWFGWLVSMFLILNSYNIINNNSGNLWNAYPAAQSTEQK